MGALFKNLCILFAFVLAGFFLRRKGILSQGIAQGLSKLEVWLFTPCLQFYTFSTGLTPRELADKSDYLLWGIGLFAATCIVGWIFSRLLTTDEYSRKVYMYSFLAPNYGFLGYTLMDKMYGPEMMLNMTIFVLPVSIYACSFGFRSLCCRGKISVRDFVNPLFLAMLAGAAFGLLQVRPPDIVLEFAAYGKACMAPVGMLLTGIVIADFNLKELLRDKTIYAASLIRLIVLPLIILVPLSLLSVQKEIMIIASVLYTLPAGVNTIMYPQIVQQDCRIGAGMLLITNVCSMATIPILLWLLL